MLQERLSAGARAGLIATAATSGALIAFGLRASSALDAFFFLGRHLGGFQDVIYPRSTVVLAGILLHAAWTIAWCVTFALVALSLRPAPRVLAAVFISAVAYVTSSKIIGSVLATSVFGGSRWLFVYVIFCIAMYKGTRFAP